ncbi:hypothetical protein QAD02_007482 [Eretmocerus hayati]|uniref:Uncharacterized protein n=1 Tax=Eretmocerus hayati TaxID=131215 RepID=A0ACC2N848_9HYME|nr:hypothetical protein QAD02_007482 [Eretmocerus hayati]
MTWSTFTDEMYVGPVRLKSDVLPHKFECQPNRALQCLDYNRGAFKKLNQRRSVKEMILEQDQQRGLNKSPVKVSATSNVTTVKRTRNNLSIESSESEIDVNFSASERILLDSSYEDADVQDLVQLPGEDPQVASGNRPRALGKGSIIAEQIQQGTSQRLVPKETQKNIECLPFMVFKVLCPTSASICAMQRFKQQDRPLAKHANLLTLCPQISKASPAQANLAAGHCMFQAQVTPVLTWSEYKKCNTIKYIIACMRDGLIVFISKGYEGRISDMTLFETCGIMKILPEGCAVMADRGFKQIEEVLETKRVSSLRIHVERLIRRVREYDMLRPHSRLALKMLPIFNDIMYTACGLISLQNPIIKS